MIAPVKRPIAAMARSGRKCSQALAGMSTSAFHDGPGHRKGILETNLPRSHCPPPGKDQRRQNRQRPGKPPGEMAGGELPAWNVVVPIPVRIAPQQMFCPLLRDEAMERSVKMDF